MSISAYLKNIVPLQMMLRLKYCTGFTKHKEVSTGSSSKRIFYLDSPDYSNLGDQAIAYAIRNFSNNFFPEYEFIEILQEKYAESRWWLKKDITDSDLIFLSGGGNMGNSYRIFEATRRLVITDFSQNRIVVFPQTLDYSNDLFGALSMRKSAAVYAAHPRLVLCAREEQSFKKMKEAYSKNHVLCLPDIVLTLTGLSEHNLPRENCVGICIRDDMESAMRTVDRSRVEQYARENYTQVLKISTISDVTRIDKNNRKKLLQKKLDEISHCKLLITDRLHGMVFGYLTKTPCVFFDNRNHKISGVYHWIHDCKYVAEAKIYDDLNTIIPNLRTDYVADCCIQDLYAQLAQCIREV